MQRKKVELVEKKDIYKGRVVTVTADTVRLPNGHTFAMELVRHPGAAAIVPLDEDGNVTLVRQARYAADGWLLEIPAGKLDHGEDPSICAERELKEETGLTAKRWTPMGFIFVSPGFCDERIHLYLARDLTRTAQALEIDEVIELEKVPLAQAIELALNGEITDAKSICALLRVRHYLAAR